MFFPAEDFANNFNASCLVGIFKITVEDGTVLKGYLEFGDTHRVSQECSEIQDVYLPSLAYDNEKILELFKKCDMKILLYSEIISNPKIKFKKKNGIFSLKDRMILIDPEKIVKVDFEPGPINLVNTDSFIPGLKEKDLIWLNDKVVARYKSKYLELISFNPKFRENDLRKIYETEIKWMKNKVEIEEMDKLQTELLKKKVVLFCQNMDEP